MNKIIDRMRDRCAQDSEDSDAMYFRSLLSLSEMVIKLTCSFFVTAMEESSERPRYQITYQLIRADGLGDWVANFENIITGPYYQYLLESVHPVAKEFSQRNGAGWQKECVQNLTNIQQKLSLSTDSKEKVSLIDAFKKIVHIRNKTLGHGAQPPNQLADCCESLKTAIELIINNTSIFDYEWSYLKQNISKKYRVSKISDNVSSFDYLKSKTNHIFTEGLYIFFDMPRKNELVYSDPDLEDFYIANGGFNQKIFEGLSYITGKSKTFSAENYLIPVEALPKSITSGKFGLDVQGEIFGNLPQEPYNYIRRQEIENELISVIKDQRNPVITLHGRGGIGKTSTLLNVLHRLSKELDSFECFLWFSARDIDLFDVGPKIVAPEVYDCGAISEYFIQLMKPDYKFKNSTEKEHYFISSLQNTNTKANLFIFDNFETMKNPTEVYNWLNTHIRLPNKVIITTRFRTFKGDYPIEIKGMTKNESFDLIEYHSKMLGINNYITGENRENIYNESDGHPYIMKMLLSEYSKTKKITNISRQISSRSDVLGALFERTFSLLSEAAKRVYITLALWRSPVSEIALISVLTCRCTEVLDVDDAVSELINFSFIERVEHDQFENATLRMPKASYYFAQGKIRTSSYLYEAKEDVALLRFFGTSSSNNFNFEGRLTSFIQKIVPIVKEDEDKFPKIKDILNFICQKIPSLYFSSGVLLIPHFPDYAKELLTSYIEQNYIDEKSALAWLNIAEIDKENRGHAYIFDLVQAGMIYSDIDIESMGGIAKKINTALSSTEINTTTPDIKMMVKNYILKIIEKIDDITNEDIYSQCAWLYIHIGETLNAKEIIDRGLIVHPQNIHLCRLKSKPDFE